MSKCTSQCSESIQTPLPPTFPHLLHLFHLSKLDELYDLQLKLILLHTITWKIWKSCICTSCTRLYRTSFRTLFKNLHHYCFVKLTSIHRLLVQDLLPLDFLLLRTFMQDAFCLGVLFQWQLNSNRYENSRNACHKQLSNSINFPNFKRCS